MDAVLRRRATLDASETPRRLRHAPPNPTPGIKNTPQRIILQEADYLMFEAIDQYGPLPTRYLYEFAKKERTNYPSLQKRLTVFYNGTPSQAPYLVRPPRQFDSFEARYQDIVYELSESARQALGARRSQLPARRTNDFIHDLMTACIGASLDRTAPSLGLRYVPRAEVLGHENTPAATKGADNPLAIPVPGTDRSRVPDDLFAIEYPSLKKRYFLLEADRNTESIRGANKNAFGKKIDDYVSIMERGTKDWLGVSKLSVLTVTTNARHAQNLAEYVRKEHPKYADRFAFASEPCFGTRANSYEDQHWRVPKDLLTRLLTEPWSWAG